MGGRLLQQTLQEISEVIEIIGLCAVQASTEVRLSFFDTFDAK
jgi:hypothetical protein